MPHIQVSLPDGTTFTHELTESTVTVGRTSDNVMHIDDVSVSSHHAQLTLGDSGDYVLEDLGSTNGTWVNTTEAHQGESHPLQDGDKIRFGKIDASYASENPAEARPMPQSEGTGVVLGSASKRPADFSNASPFQTKRKKKDPAGLAVMITAIVALVAFLGAVGMAFTIKSPFQ